MTDLFEGKQAIGCWINVRKSFFKKKSHFIIFFHKQKNWTICAFKYILKIKKKSSVAHTQNKKNKIHFFLSFFYQFVSFN